MKNVTRCAVTAFALCAGFGQFGMADAATGKTPLSIPVRQAKAGLLVVQVAINGCGDYPFLLDTGSESTIVDPAFALEIGLAPTSRRNLQTSTGIVSAGASRADIVFGAVEARDAYVLHLPLDAVRAYAPEVRGVLGHDVLRKTNWLLDYGRGTVTQDLDGTVTESGGGDRLPMHWVNGRAAVSAVFGGTKADLVLDSAASRLLLFGSAGDLDATEQVSIASLSGQQHLPAVTIEPLRLGSFVVPRVKAAVLAGSAARREEGGIIPTALFGSIYFDYRSGSIIVTSPK